MGAPAPTPSSATTPSIQRKRTDNVFGRTIKKPFVFQDVNCWIPGRSKQILHSVSGAVKPGQMLAVMGPSGSGKTTMLNVLAQKLPPNLVEGAIRIGTRKVSKRDRETMGFVFQDDLMLSNLTVRETVSISADLKLPLSVTAASKKSRVDTLLDILGLAKVANQRIGSIGIRGISGGERKRTAVANELVTAPSILFLDEPTSGLDATTAFVLVQTLRDLCDRGMTIVCCIHQPRENIFLMFDQLLVLEAGRTAYFGPAKNCREYLEATTLSSGQKLQLPPFTSVADWILDLMNDREIAPQIAEHWTTSFAEKVERDIEALDGRCSV